MAFLVDSSGSFGRSNWLKMKDFVSGIISDITVSSDGNHMAAIVYSNNAEVVFDFNTLQGSRVTSAEYDKVVQKMPYQRGFTYIDRALALANNKIFTTAAGMRANKAVSKVNNCIIFKLCY
jgi:hypothetical protein